MQSNADLDRLRDREDERNTRDDPHSPWYDPEPARHDKEYERGCGCIGICICICAALSLRSQAGGRP
jgi:hypothetical protein